MKTVTERSRLLAASLLRSGCAVRLRLRGWSMKPLLPSGSLVSIAPATGRPRKGDVILYEASPQGPLIAHRVTAEIGNRVVTKGDACLESDTPIHRSQILGTLTRVESPFVLPLTGPLPRILGRLCSTLYPRIVRFKHAASRFTVVGPSPEAPGS